VTNSQENESSGSYSLSRVAMLEYEKRGGGESCLRSEDKSCSLQLLILSHLTPIGRLPQWEKLRLTMWCFMG
jgi:hypothetical protein